MQPERAQIIGIQALGWLVGNEELRSVFLGSTGGSDEDFLKNTEEMTFLASILEFITMDDTWVMAFCDAHDLAYDQPLMARYALPGAESVHWT